MSRPGHKEPKARTRALAALRSGSAGQLRETVRCLLLLIQGFDCLHPGGRGLRLPQHQGHLARSRSPSEMRQDMIVAHDGLLELGYEAAAEELTDRGRDPDLKPGRSDGWWYRAREALAILEMGPPSIRLDTVLVLRKPMYRGFQIHPDHDWQREVVIAKAPEGVRPWVVFVVGREGRYDRSQSKFSHNTHHKTLAEAKAYWHYGPKARWKEIKS